MAFRFIVAETKWRIAVIRIHNFLYELKDFMKNVVALFLSILMFLGSLPSEFVICLGSNDHVKIEVSVNKSCHRSHNDSSSGLDCDVHCCDDCVDIPITNFVPDMTILHRPTPISLKMSVRFISAAIESMLLFYEFHRLDKTDIFSMIPSLILSSIRSTVLIL
ncbi:MAG: hypothetical protein B6244_10750 [Candidatus Cloacimonetes bacterium 4572_55]|nr:MAG: hypothetical protein B6244_10750 [Candidatus Cloacimonetes bacterium 4572_55]